MLTYFPVKTNVFNITSDTSILSITATSSNVIAIQGDLRITNCII